MSLDGNFVRGDGLNAMAQKINLTIFFVCLFGGEYDITFMNMSHF